MLDEAKAPAGRGGLIPSERSYVEQLRRFEYQSAAAGGPQSLELTPSQREVDREAPLTISEELGHEREQTAAAYLGR